MANIDNVRLWTSPITGKIEFMSVNAKNAITARRTLSEGEICSYLVQLIEYMRGQGADTITKPTTGKSGFLDKKNK